MAGEWLPPRAGGQEAGCWHVSSRNAMDPELEEFVSEHAGASTTVEPIARSAWKRRAGRALGHRSDRASRAPDLSRHHAGTNLHLRSPATGPSPRRVAVGAASHVFKGIRFEHRCAIVSALLLASPTRWSSCRRIVLDPVADADHLRRLPCWRSTR